MKHLFLILFLVTYAWGQEKVDTLIRAKDNQGYLIYRVKGGVIETIVEKYIENGKQVGSPIITIHPSETFVEDAIINDYDAYSKECYADSMKSNLAMIDSLVDWRFRYYHTRPTFEGFINYLRAKVGK
jgi:hypothetical protein